MKPRRAVFALGIPMVVLASLLVVRHFMRREAPRAVPAPSARSAPPVRSVPQLLPTPSPPAAAHPSPPPPPPYLDTTATTLVEQRAALFTNMQNQLDLPAGALEKIRAIFA